MSRYNLVPAKVKRQIKRRVYSFDRRLYGWGVRDLRALTLPHFLGLGAGQSGSTWLHRNLERHPEVFVPPRKETHYFTRSFDTQSLASYASIFADGQDAVRGEITPSYSQLRLDRIRCIRDIMPDVRLIFVLRNPIDKVWSAARRVMGRLSERMKVSLQEIDDAEFHDYFHKEWAYRPERNMAGYYEPGLLECHYLKAIDNWTSVFPAQQLLVMFFEEISLDPQGFMTKVCKHINASPHVDWGDDFAAKVNTNPEHDLPQRFRIYLQDLYRDEITALHERFGQPVKPWLEAIG
jgi:hypothetical protein